MCGIAGFFTAAGGIPDARSILKPMCEAIRHRGPNDDGFFHDGPVGLGMRRLSIIDLDGGHQPIANENQSVWTIFNGEIYNFAALREALEAKGHRFTTASDTEVIVHQYEEDGADCVQRFNGMFAFAVWDERKQSLFLARDRMGIKPLYYYWDGSRFFFASEIKALLASGQVPRELDPTALWDYLTLRYVPQPKTIWKNIHKLLPGHTLTLSRENPRPALRRYWDIPLTLAVPEKPLAECTREFSALFLDAVRIHLQADVPVGVLLSGGLDSSAVAAAVKEVHGMRLDSFSVAFADSPQTNELPYARQVAAAVGMNHHEVVIGRQEFTDFLPRLAHFMDEPMADLASVPLYYVSRLARESVKVVVSGEGSDEILGGYDFDRVVARWDSVPGRIAHRLGVRSLPMMTDLFSSAEKQSLLKKPLHSPDTLDSFREIMRRRAGVDPLHRTLYLYCQSWLADDLLMKADRMTMANSIELRVPFLDYRLVEWAAKTPPSALVGKSPDGTYQTKRVLREFARARLPAEIIDRPKQGFPVPVYDWLSGSLKAWATDLIGADNARLKTYLDASAVNNLLARGTAPTATQRERHRLWQLLILELWMRQWLA